METNIGNKMDQFVDEFIENQAINEEMDEDEFFYSKNFFFILTITKHFFFFKLKIFTSPFSGRKKSNQYETIVASIQLDC